MNTEKDYYPIGRIARPHGLKGEVTVTISPGLNYELVSTEVLFLKIGDQFVPYFIEAISEKGNKAYVRFEGINNLDEAQIIANSEIYLPKAVRPTLENGEFYDDEVIGFVVEEESFGKLGSIQEIVHSGMQRLLSIDFKDDHLLIPVNGPFIKRIDKGNKTMTVLLPEGYLDL